MPDTWQTSASLLQRGASHTLPPNTPKTKITYQHLKIKHYRNTKHDYFTSHSPSSKANRLQPLHPPTSQPPPPRGSGSPNPSWDVHSISDSPKAKGFNHPSSPQLAVSSITFIWIVVSTQLNRLCTAANHHPTVPHAATQTFINSTGPPCWLIYWL